MKALILFVLSVLANSAYGQRAAISLDKMNVSYTGADNILCDTGTKKLMLINGLDTVPLSDRGFSCRPKGTGKRNVTITKRTDNGTSFMDTVAERVKNSRAPLITIGMKRNDTLSIPIFRIQPGPLDLYSCYDLRPLAKIYRFKTTVVPNSEIIYSHPTSATQFNEETKLFFETIVPDDVVWITDIAATDANKTRLYLKDFYIAVK